MAVLTDTKARHIKPDDKPLPHGGITGLTLHPSSVKGRGKWVFRYVSPVTQKRRNAGLGTYPEVSIAEAARTARIMREQLAAGDDPLEIKKAESEKVAIPTFADAARRVHAELSPGYSAAIFLIPICISFDTAEKRRYATYLILNRRFSFEF